MDIELKEDLRSVSEKCTNVMDKIRTTSEEALSMKNPCSFGAMNKVNESVEILNQAIHENPSTVIQKAAELKSQTRKSVMEAVCGGEQTARVPFPFESNNGFVSVSEKNSESGRVENALQVISSALFLSVSDRFINDLMSKLENCKQQENLERQPNESFAYESVAEEVLLDEPMEESETLDDASSDVLGSEEAEIGELMGDWSSMSYDNDLDDSIFNDFTLGKSEEMKLINDALYEVEDIQSSLEVTLNLVEHLSVLHNATAAIPSKTGLVESQHFPSCSSLVMWQSSPAVLTQPWTNTEFDEQSIAQMSDRDYTNRHSMMKLKRIKIMYECESALVQVKHATKVSTNRDSKADGYMFKVNSPQVASPQMMHSPARHSFSRSSLRGSTPRNSRASATPGKATPI